MALLEVIFQDSFLFCDLCGCKAQVKSSPVEVVEGVRIRQRFWECPECGDTGKTAWPISSAKPSVGSGGAVRSKELVKRVVPRPVPVGVGNAAKHAVSRRHR